MPHARNLFEDLPGDLTAEVFETLMASGPVRIERIVSLGHATAEGQWYDQDTDEWVLVLKGAARLTIAGKPPIDLVPGSFVNLPARTRHRVDWTDPGTPTVWLAVHSVAANGAPG